MTLRQQLSDGPIVVAPGIYDALGASLAQQAGFRTLYLSGASIAYTRFGRPDIGLVGMSEVAETLSVIRERVELPVVVDADTGFGNALNVQRTVALFERSGASAIQIEDQTLPKRCGHLTGKTLVSTGEMVGKVKAACDARRSDETLIVARTDAIAVEGLSQALDRARAYVEAGADIAFVEAPRSLEEMKQVVATLGGRVPLIANMVEGGSTPALDAAALQALGFKLAIFPGGLVRAIGRLMQDYFASLQRHGSTEPFRNNMLDFVGLNEVLGTAEMLERGKRYDEGARVAPINRKGAAE
jgi:2-methylisocitrate lyase-like PEP mutase family enzyme